MTVKWSLIAAKCIQDEFSAETEADNERIEFRNGRKVGLGFTIGFKELFLISVQQFVEFTLCLRACLESLQKKKKGVK